jgi:hypothetical protein
MGVGPREVLFAGFAAVVVAMIVVYVFPVRCKTPRTEGFQNEVQLNKCPNAAQGAKAFTDKKGNLNCCMGQVNGDKCEGTVFCTFSGNNPGVTLCSDYVRGNQKNGKYTGEVPEFLLTALSVDGPKKFKDYANQHLFPTLKRFAALPNLQSTTIPQELNRLLEEETQFVNQNLAKYDAEYLAREFLYIDKTFNTIMSKSNVKPPTANLQKQLVCSS